MPQDPHEGHPPSGEHSAERPGAPSPMLIKGTRAFELPIKVADATWAKKVVVGDFTGNGMPDFAVLHWETGGRCVVGGVEYKKGFLVIPYLNTTVPKTTPATFAPMPPLSLIDDSYRIYDMYPSDLAIGDVNGNGKDDIVVANANLDRIYVYLSNGDGTFQPPLEILDTGGDDASYIALGDFNADGKLDIAVLHLRRKFPGDDFEWKLAFLFGNGDGTFQAPIILDQGDASFGGPADDGGGYYKSTTFSMFTMLKSAWVAGAYRDAVSMNGVMMWWDGAAIQVTAKVNTKFTSPESTAAIPHAFVGDPDLAAAGGRQFWRSAVKPGDSIACTVDPGPLDRLIHGKKGGGISEDYRGTLALVADFDNDGFLDLLLFSDDVKGNYAGHEMFMSYGYHPTYHPMSLQPPTTVAELHRFKFFPNPSGWWASGHRPGHAVAADFNGDGYRDLLTVTVSGVLLHMNFGTRGYQALPPTIQQIWNTSSHKPGQPSDPWMGDILQVQFLLNDQRPVVGAVFRSTTRPDVGAFVRIELSETDPTKSGRFVVLGEDTLAPDTYEVTLHNGVVESTNSVKVRIIARPVTFDLATIDPVKKGAAQATLSVMGFFGSSADLSDASFFIEETGVPATRKPIAPLHLSIVEASFPISIHEKPGSRTLTVIHKTRGTAQVGVSIPDFRPRFLGMMWVNPGGMGRGSLLPGGSAMGPNPQAGATIIFEASMLYAPDTKRWSLVDSSLVEIATGDKGDVGAIGFDNDNGHAAYFVNLPFNIKEGSGYRFSVVTASGLRSEFSGPLTFEGATSTTPVPIIWVGVEDLEHGLVGASSVKGYAAMKYDESDPSKPIGAKQLAMLEYPGKYQFTELTASEAAYPGGLANARRWDFQGTDSKGTHIADTVTAISKERAAVNAIDDYDLVTIDSIARRAGDP
jgi:hypothetical protein